jgi:Flp pilus assembly protein TadB
MILGALAVTTAVATEKERGSMREALVRECARYDLDYDRIIRLESNPASATSTEGRSWWDYIILAVGVGVFVWLGVQAHVPVLAMNFTWVAILAVLLLVSAVGGAWVLWRATRFS